MTGPADTAAADGREAAEAARHVRQLLDCKPGIFSTRDRADLRAVLGRLEQLAAANERAETAEGREVRDPAVCVCGDRECPDYWHSVHEQMNSMRVRADQNVAGFTAAMLEEICELRTEADELRARLDGLGELRKEWGYRFPGPGDPDEAGFNSAAAVRVSAKPGDRIMMRLVGGWREAPDAAADGHSATQTGAQTDSGHGDGSHSSTSHGEAQEADE